MGRWKETTTQDTAYRQVVDPSVFPASGPPPRLFLGPAGARYPHCQRRVFVIPNRFCSRSRDRPRVFDPPAESASAESRGRRRDSGRQEEGSALRLMLEVLERAKTESCCWSSFANRSRSIGLLQNRSRGPRLGRGCSRFSTTGCRRKAEFSSRSLRCVRKRRRSVPNQNVRNPRMAGSYTRMLVIPSQCYSNCRLKFRRTTAP
jgi:hypothetical protein